ncbi:hypothetical protein Tco_1077533 [Tanacetum coccineum]
MPLTSSLSPFMVSGVGGRLVMLGFVGLGWNLIFPDVCGLTEMQSLMKDVVTLFLGVLYMCCLMAYRLLSMGLFCYKDELLRAATWFAVPMADLSVLASILVGLSLLAIKGLLLMNPCC